MQNISAIGLSANVISTVAFPVGFTIKKFADDADPIVIEPVEVMGTELLIDGTVYTFQKGALVKVAISVVAGSPDDINLNSLLLSEFSQNSKILPLPSITTLTLSYGDGGLVMFSNGGLIAGPPAKTVASNGRYKSQTYTFGFGQVTSTAAPFSLVSSITSALNLPF